MQSSKSDLLKKKTTTKPHGKNEESKNYIFYVPPFFLIGHTFATLHYKLCLGGVSLVPQVVKNPPAMQEIPVRFLGWEDPLEKG